MIASLTVLGSGTSMGVPTIGCGCEVCRSSDPHDKRLRPSILLKYADHVVLVDTTPDFRTQAIREGITRIDAVLYTHAHADHILGLDDLRPLSFLVPARFRSMRARMRQRASSRYLPTFLTGSTNLAAWHKWN